MKAIQLGRTGLRVSRVGFGGIPIQRLDENEAIRVVRRCLDLGVTLIDTANGYTTSEERIGKAIAGRREQVIVATKTGARDRDGALEHLHLSLERLGTEYVDLFETLQFPFNLQFEGVVPDPGIETTAEIEEIADIVAGEWELTRQERAEIERIRGEVGTRFCRRCGYCQPCAQGVAISTVLNVRSFWKRFSAERFTTGWVPEAMASGKECTECGECEAKCPYGLPIPEMIAESVAFYEEVRGSR